MTKGGESETSKAAKISGHKKDANNMDQTDTLPSSSSIGRAGDNTVFPKLCNTDDGGAGCLYNSHEDGGPASEYDGGLEFSQFLAPV